MTKDQSKAAVASDSTLNQLPAAERTAAACRSACDRQAAEWARGNHVLVEEVLAEFPELGEQEEESRLLDLIYNEVLLRVQYDQPARIEDFELRFPEMTTSLRRMFEVHEVIEGGDVEPPKIGPDEDTQPSSSSPRPVSGFPRIEGYQFIEQIGRGAMGVVYRARQEGTDRDVAVKVFYGGIEANEEEVARFGIEAQAAARLNHPSIVSVYEAGAHEEVHFLTMEWIDGCTLAQRLADGPLAAREAAQLLETIARAVDYAHESGIIHRDLKPHNILLDVDGAPHVADFGLARFNDRNTTWTTGGRILGTLHYMSPEQVRGDQNAVGPGTDVYGLGAVLFQCLSGQPPFADRTAPQLVHDLLHRDPELASHYATQIPADLAQICRKSLEKRPSERYASAGTFADDLQRFLNGLPVSARPLPVTSLTWRAIQRRPAVSALVACLAALLIAFSAGAFAVKQQFDESNIQLTEFQEQADAAKRVGQFACVETQIADTDRRLLDRTASQRSKVIEMVDKTIELAEGLPPDGFRQQRLRTQVASALSRSDIQLVADGDDASAPFPPAPDSMPQNAYSVTQGGEPDQLIVVNHNDGSDQLLSTGFDIRGIRVHPYAPVAAVWNEHDLQLIELDGTEKALTVANRATRRIQSADWSDCGSLLALGSADHFAYVLQYEPQTRSIQDQPLTVLKGARSWVNHVRFVHDHLLMASCRGGERTRLYDCNTGDKLISFRGVGSEVNWTGSQISGTLAGEDAKWDVVTPRIKSVFSIAKGINGACAVACNLRSDRFLICEWDEITLWDAHDGHVLDKIPALNPVDVSFAGTDHAIFLDDSGIHTLSLKNTTKKRNAKLIENDTPPLDGPRGFEVHDLALSTQFPNLAIPRKSTLDLFSIQNNRLEFRESVEACGVTHASCGRHGRWLATSIDGEPGFELFHLAKGGPPKSFDTDESIVGFRFHADSKRLLVGEPSRCSWYDLESLEKLDTKAFKEPAGNYYGMQWSPDGSLIAIANRSDAIDLIDADSGETLVSLPVSQGGSWLRFTPDGNSLLCRDSSFRLVVWDLRELRNELESMGLGW